MESLKHIYTQVSTHHTHLRDVSKPNKLPLPLTNWLGRVNHPKFGIDNSYDLGVIMHEFPSLFIGEFRS